MEKGQSSGETIETRDERILTKPDETRESSKSGQNEKNAVVHMLPCKIEYSGVAPVSSYFKITKKRKWVNGKDLLQSHFRGRELNGLVVDFPEGVVGQIVTRSSTNFTVNESFQSMHVWAHDKIPDTTHIEESLKWFQVAKSVSQV